MIYGSVCSGIEAATVAWEPLGWRPAFFSEIEKFPSAVLAHHYGSNMPGEPPSGNGVPNLGDMTKFEDWPEYAIDILVGGTPCQSFSIAGLRKGLADPRGNLMLTYLAIARRYQPRWLVWENVPGVLSSNEGRDFAAFIQGLEEIGYHAAWRVLDAEYIRVDGYSRAVAQRRNRVFAVGYLGDWRPPAAVLLEPEGLQGHPAPRREAGEGTSAEVAPSLVSSGRGIERIGETRGQDPVVAELIANSGDVSYCVSVNGQRSNDAETETLIAHALRGEGFDASEDGTGRGTPLVPIAFSSKDHGADAMEGVSPTLRAGGHDGSHANAGVMPVIAFDARQSDVIVYGEKAGPLDTDGNSQAVAFDMRVRDGGSQFEGPHHTANIRASNGGSSRSYVADNWAVRRLTELECERLQGFNDNYTRIPWKGKPESDCPGGPRYKAIGNSMAVNVMRWIGRRIQMVEELMLEIEREQ